MKFISVCDPQIPYDDKGRIQLNKNIDYILTSTARLFYCKKLRLHNLIIASQNSGSAPWRITYQSITTNKVISHRNSITPSDIYLSEAISSIFCLIHNCAFRGKNVRGPRIWLLLPGSKVARIRFSLLFSASRVRLAEKSEKDWSQINIFFLFLEFMLILSVSAFGERMSTVFKVGN